MADKDKLRVLKMLKDNPSSMFKSEGIREHLGTALDAAEGKLDDFIEKNPLPDTPSMRKVSNAGDKEVSKRVKDSILKQSAKMLGKHGPKAASILGGAVGLGLSGAAEAFDAESAGMPVEKEAMMIAEQGAMQDYDKSPAAMDARKARGEQTPEDVMRMIENAKMKRYQKAIGRSREEDIEDQIAVDNKIADLFSDPRSTRMMEEMAEAREARPTKVSSRDALKELSRMRLEKGLLE